MDLFRRITGDENPLHNDKSFAAARGFPDCVAYGMLTASFCSTLAGVFLQGENSLIQQVEVKFVRPVLLGTKCLIEGKVVGLNNTFKQIDI